MATRRELPYVWVTWLAKLITGQTQCTWAPWFKAHYTEYARAKTDFNLSQWRADHGRAVDELARERELLGETVYKEERNGFRVRLTKRLVLAGRPDLVAVGPDGRATVYDVKTGQERESDIAQMKLYLLCLPVGSWQWKAKALAGCVVYTNGASPRQVDHSAIDDDFRARTRYYADLLD